MSWDDGGGRVIRSGKEGSYGLSDGDCVVCLLWDVLGGGVDCEGSGCGEKFDEVYGGWVLDGRMLLVDDEEGMLKILGMMSFCFIFVFYFMIM